MDHCKMSIRRAGYCLTLCSYFIFVHNTEALAVSNVYHIQFCNGEQMSVSCPDDWQIHVSSSYFVYVHGVNEGGATCRQHLNSTKQCLRKIQFYDPDYYRLIIKSCQSKQRCDDGLVARIGDPKVCWDYPRSPSDYLTFSYVCVNVHIDQSTTAYVGTPTSSHKPHGSTKPSGITGTTHWTNNISYRTTSWPGLIRTTSQRQWPMSTSRVGQLTRMLLYTSTMSIVPHRTTSYPYSHSTTQPNQPQTTGAGNTQPKPPIASSKTETNNQSQRLMAVAIPVAVVAMIAAIVAISAVIACRSPEKKSSLKRKLSQNGSVYYNNSDRHSLGGDSVQTRASIHGIINLGYDITNKSFGDTAYVDHVILNAQEPEVTENSVQPIIHINPSSSAEEVTSDPELLHRVHAREPLAEQINCELNEVELTCNYI